MRTKTFAALLAVLILLLGVGVNALAQSGVAGWYQFDTNVKMEGDLTVIDDVSVGDQLTAADLTASDDLTVTDDATIGDNLTVTDDLIVGEWIRPTKGTTVTVTAGSIITPTGTYQPLASSGAVTTSTSSAIADGTTQGQILLLINTNASDAITIDGTGGNVECKADKALGTQDTLMLMWNGADWVCLSLADNS